MITTAIVGVDCATQPQNVGLALAVADKEGPILEEVRVGHRGESISEIVFAWIKNRPRALLALDAPLGWPAFLGEVLIEHTAGEPITRKGDEIFARDTEHYMADIVKKRPFEVGANLIARTAHASLALLHELRGMTRQQIPLAWHSNFKERFAVIEVYPAATLAVRGIPFTNYKKSQQRAAREEIISELEKHIIIDSAAQSAMVERADALDAAVCALAATDFLVGNAIPPRDQDLARKEGWIWVLNRAPGTE